MSDVLGPDVLGKLIYCDNRTLVMPDVLGLDVLGKLIRYDSFYKVFK